MQLLLLFWLASPLLIIKAQTFPSLVHSAQRLPIRIVYLLETLPVPVKSKGCSFTFVIRGLSLPVCLLPPLITAGCVYRSDPR